MYQWSLWIVIIKMKQFEKWCIDYAERWNKPAQWEFYALAKDNWLSGFHKGRYEAQFNENTDRCAEDAGNEEVEVDIGNNQIGSNYKVKSKEEQLRFTLSQEFKCDDVRIVVDKDGNVSFQGSFKL